jgi:phosphatidylserine/phosphatidylglycerophosphate/cardiolipin synthase-like enzyme
MSMHRLAREIHHLIADMPDDLVIRLATVLKDTEITNRNGLRKKVLEAVPQPAVRNQVDDFLDFWQRDNSSVSAESVALALVTAMEVEGHYRKYQQLDLVWTGPDSKIIPLRRTDQALLQLINEAKRSLHIVSFAVYKVGTISDAIYRAIERGVVTAIYLETPDASEGKISFDTVGALGKDIAENAQMYVWPLEKRLLSADGNHGSLHAKVAIADGQLMLISSANLTEYAMKLNMEMGVLVRGGPLPKQVESHLIELTKRNTFKPI